MSNSTRNSIVLATILIIMSTFWALTTSNLHRKTAILLKHNESVSRSIDSLSVELDTIESLKAEYELKQALMSQQSKFILGADTPSITYGYLLRLLRWSNLDVDYDFASNLSKSDSLAGKFNEYIISGSTRYDNLLKLTDQIERQRAAVTIEDLSISTGGTAQPDTVNFSMILHTHYRQGGLAAENLELRKIPLPPRLFSLFKPRISDEILFYDIDPSLMRVDEVRLIGMSGGKAFFRDAQGIIRILTRGSSVAYGYLHSIDEAAGKVIFHLMKYGFEEDFTIFTEKTQ